MARIDCSDTVNFITEIDRMCHNTICGDDCPVHMQARKDGASCGYYLSKHPEYAVDIVQKWSDEHPQKTRLEDLLEKYPNVPRSGDGTPHFSPSMLGYCRDCPECQNWNSPGVPKCWNEPLDGGATGKAVE